MPLRRLPTKLLACMLAIAGITSQWAIPAHAGSTGISWSLDRNSLWMVGIDKVYPGGGSPGGYEYVYEYPLSNHGNHSVLPSPVGVTDNRALEQIRMEFYNRCSLVRTDPRHCITSTATVAGNDQYNPWEGDTAAAVRISPTASANIGAVRTPKSTDANAGVLNVKLVSRKAIPDNRLRLTLFQTTGQPLTSTGYPLDAFAHGWNRGTAFRTGALWNGRYIAFLNDFEADASKGGIAYKRQIVGFIYVRGTTNITLDLDAVCMGIDECQTLEPTPTVAGDFHPLPATRIVDTRVNKGIAGAIRPGDGRSVDGRPAVRLSEKLNHELRVVGVGGIPATGVSSVLLNVTTIAPTANGGLALYPKPPTKGSVFDELAMFGAAPTDLSQLQWRAGHSVSSQVLVRVGAGGRLRLVNRSFGTTHLVIEVIGWYDSSQPGQDGFGVTALDAARVLYTGTGLNVAPGAVPVGNVRTATLAGRGGVPADARGVIASMSDTPVGGANFVTAWPAGAAYPGVSTISAAPGTPRTNMVTTSLGTGGAWSIRNGGPSPAQVAVDVQGWFGPNVGAAGKVTTLNATRVLAPALFKTGTSARVNVSTRLAGIANPKAVYVNVTMNGATTNGYLTIGGQVPQPTTVAMRYGVGLDRSNLMLVPLAADGSFVLRNTTLGAAGAGFVAIDLVGVVTGT